VAKPIKMEIIDSLRGLVEHMVREIVAHPAEVAVDVVPASYRLVVELRTNEDDVGYVIGQGGHVVTGVRSILAAFGRKHGIHITMDYVTEQEKRLGQVH